jgi:hypothetical protein
VKSWLIVAEGRTGPDFIRPNVTQRAAVAVPIRRAGVAALVGRLTGVAAAAGRGRVARVYRRAARLRCVRQSRAAVALQGALALFGSWNSLQTVRCCGLRWKGAQFPAQP